MKSTEYLQYHFLPQEGEVKEGWNVPRNGSHHSGWNTVSVQLQGGLQA